MAPEIRLDLPDFSKYGADFLVLEAVLPPPAKNVSRFKQRSQDDNSGIAEAENGHIYLSLFLDAEGPDPDDLADLELVASSYPEPPLWVVSCQFRYDPARYGLACGLPTSVQQFSKEYGAGLLTGIKYVLARPQGFLFGFYVDALTNPEGQVLAILTTIYGREALPISKDLLSRILDLCLPHANALVKERISHAASAP